MQHAESPQGLTEERISPRHFLPNVGTHLPKVALSLAKVQWFTTFLGSQGITMIKEG